MNESWADVGSKILNDPNVKSLGNRVFKKAAKWGLKKFGKKGTRALINTGKTVLKSKEFQDAAKKGGKKILDKAKNTLKNRRASTKVQEEDNINEAWGLAIKGGITAAKSAAKAAAKTAVKSGGKQAAKRGVSKGKLIKNFGKALKNDIKDTAKAAYDASISGAARNTFYDENGKFDFNPVRAVKKQYKGALKTADNLFTGGLGQMAYDKLNKSTKKPSQKQLTERWSSIIDRALDD